MVKRGLQFMCSLEALGCGFELSDGGVVGVNVSNAGV